MPAHPSAGRARAAIGIPDETRGEAIKVFVKLREGYAPTPALEHELRQFVRSQLAAYEYPRHVAFVEELPLTVTGKIRRAELRRRERDAAVDAPAAGE